MDRKTYFEGTIQVSTTQEDTDNIEINMLEGSNYTVEDVTIKSTNILDNYPDYKVVDFNVEVILRMDEGSDSLSIVNDTDNWMCDEETTINSVETRVGYSK